MNEPNSTRPDFAKPPLIEVALSVQFDPLPALRTGHLGLFWAQVRDRFPVYEEQLPLPQVIERFGGRISDSPKIEIKLPGLPPLSRAWFLNTARDQLIQIQQDRLSYNWRKADEADSYPHYGTIRQAFSDAYTTFQQFLTREDIGDLIPIQCEVTYLDHIIAGDGWQRHGQLDEVMTVWSAPPNHSLLPEPEQASFSVQYLMRRGGTSEPLGRLHVDLTPAYRREDSLPIFVVSTTARGRPDGKELEDVLRFFDVGHEWVIRSFLSITNSKMQDIWRRTDDR